LASYEWRGIFENGEVNRLHAEAFETRRAGDDEWDWKRLVQQHSLGWVVARHEGALVGFVNVPWDGLLHAWVQDTMVTRSARGRGIGTAMVDLVKTECRTVGCEWLHVDFESELGAFYVESCGFTPSAAGVMRLA
jgi:GNAT superfamily N-acetyltransferase